MTENDLTTPKHFPTNLDLKSFDIWLLYKSDWSGTSVGIVHLDLGMKFHLCIAFVPTGLEERGIKKKCTHC